MTDEQVAQLRELWPTGHSTAEIGRRLGVSKNTVCGKAKRLALPKRKVHPNFARAPRQGAAELVAAIARTTSAAPSAAPYPTPTHEPEVRAIGTPRGECMWPVGHPGEPGFRYCCAPAALGQSYCPACRARAYVKVRDRREAPA